MPLTFLMFCLLEWRMLPRTVGLLYGGSTGFLIVILQSGLTLIEGPGKNRGVVFDFQAELLTYCESDVRLLKLGCLTFMQDFQARAQFNPFEQMTVASACNRYLRMHCMEENTIASEPPLGWRGSMNHSQTSMEWLTWCERNLRHRAW